MYKKKVLIVEDEADWREILQGSYEIVLETMELADRYELVFASSQEEALDRLREGNLALVSMDLNLTAATKGTAEGFTLLDYLASSNPDAWSIIVSGQTESEFMQKGYKRYNILEFIEKSGAIVVAEFEKTLEHIFMYRSVLDFLKAGGAVERAREDLDKVWEEAPELRKTAGLRVKTELQEAENAQLRARLDTHSLTHLPTDARISAELKKLLVTDQPWEMLRITLVGMDDFIDAYGSETSGTAYRIAAHFLQKQAPEHFVGHYASGEFIVIVVGCARNDRLHEKLRDSFEESTNSLLYPNRDLVERVTRAGSRPYRVPILWLNIERKSSEQGPYYSLHDLTGAN